jgi:hypothetical protein
MFLYFKYILFLIVGGTIGFFTAQFSTKEKIRIVERTNIEYKTIERDYSTMTNNAIISELYKYDTSKPMLDGTMVNPNTFRATAELNKRKWSREFILEGNSTSNFKTYLIVGGAGIIAGGYGTYRLIKWKYR